VTKAQPRERPVWLLRSTYSSSISPSGENSAHRSCSVACAANQVMLSALWRLHSNERPQVLLGRLHKAGAAAFSILLCLVEPHSNRGHALCMAGNI